MSQFAVADGAQRSLGDGGQWEGRESRARTGKRERWWVGLTGLRLAAQLARGGMEGKEGRRDLAGLTVSARAE